MIAVDTQKSDLWLEFMYSLICTNTDEAYDSFVGREKPIEIVTTGSTAAVTVDLKSETFVELMQSRSASVNPISIKASIVQDWDRIFLKLDALKGIVGMYTELSDEQQCLFDEAIKRRPLFK